MCCADLAKACIWDRFQRFPQPLQPVLCSLGHIPALIVAEGCRWPNVLFAAIQVCTLSWHAVRDSTSWYLGGRSQLTAHQGCSPKLGVTSAHRSASSRTCKSPAEGSQECVASSGQCQIGTPDTDAHYVHLLPCGSRINTCMSVEIAVQQAGSHPAPVVLACAIDTKPPHAGSACLGNQLIHTAAGSGILQPMPRRDVLKCRDPANMLRVRYLAFNLVWA